MAKWLERDRGKPMVLASNLGQRNSISTFFYYFIIFRTQAQMGVALMSLHCSWTRIYIKWEGKSEKCSAEKCGREGDLKFLEVQAIGKLKTKIRDKNWMSRLAAVHRPPGGFWKIPETRITHSRALYMHQFNHTIHWWSPFFFFSTPFLQNFQISLSSTLFLHCIFQTSPPILCKFSSNCNGGSSMPPPSMPRF